MTVPEALLVSLLLGLGTARAAAVISIDKISEPLRDLIFHYYPPEDDDEKGWYYQCMRKATREERRERFLWITPWWQKRFTPLDPNVSSCRQPSFLGQLISCPKCVSVWIGAANFALFFAFPQADIYLNTFLALTLISAILDVKAYK